MTGPIWRLVPILAGLLLALTTSSCAAQADPVLHERILQALHELTLNDAALHRDMLRARAGLLPNYDPLVRASRGVSKAIEILRVAGAAPYGGSSGASSAASRARCRGGRTGSFCRGVQVRQCAAPELAGVLHARQPRPRPAGGVATEVGALVNAMLQFMRDPREEIREAEPR